MLQDPDGKYGTTAMAAYMFDEGAGPYDSAELKRRLTRIGATLGASNTQEYMYVSFSTPSAYKDEAFELLRLAINAPRFDAEPIARARAQYLNSVEAAAAAARSTSPARRSAAASTASIPWRSTWPA